MTKVAPAMSRDAVEAAIECLGRADGPSHARSLARDITPLAPVLDVELKEKLRLGLEIWQLDSGVARAPLSLGVGQTWLLLHAGGRDGHIARLVARDAPDREASSSGECPRVRPVELGYVLHGLTAVASHACRQLPATLAGATVLEVQGGAGAIFEVTGRSLELPAAVALLGHVLQRAADPTCAGSACVDADGSLAPVTHLKEKVDALRRDFPGVRTVVVAEGQALPDFGTAIAFRHARTLADALPLFGLDLTLLEPSLLEDHIRRAKTFDEANTHAHAPEQWQTLSLEAWESCTALAKHEPEWSARCRAWAALFSVHGGNPAAASKFIDDADANALDAYPALRVATSTFKASGLIDLDRFDDAEELARSAAIAARRLTAHDRARLLGQALGTHGRALMHGGRYSSAEPLLQQAAEHHRQHDAKEHARSLSYVATCLRHAGRLDQALKAIDTALAANATYLRVRRIAQTTEHFLRLERGRVLLEMGAFGDAERDLLAVTPTARATTYPRVGAERSLVRLRLRAGLHARALEAFRHCIDAATTFEASGRPTLMRVAAIGLLEGLHELTLDRDEHARATGLCDRAFPSAPSKDFVAKLLDSWIF